MSLLALLRSYPLPDESAEKRRELDGVIANASVGHYADRGADLATDLSSIGIDSSDPATATRHAELLEDARDGHYDVEQRELAAAHEAPPAPPADDTPPADAPAT